MRFDDYIRARLIKAGFDPGQPRAPAGMNNGGQWVAVGGRTSNTSRPNRAELQRLYELDPPAKPVYPIETALLGIGALGRLLPYAIGEIAGIVAGVRSAVHSTTRIRRAAKAIEEFLGGKALVGRNRSGDMYIERGDKKVRFDINNTYPHPEKHFHLQRRTTSGNWVKATRNKRYPFNGETQ